ncbi:putative 6-hydroxy-d-nicotine oxidase [Diaporthe ampelina]|uniref:Putative 6-hydroxy-d-nicotine oxidase n=1 Tax=Diaporthe ampelina TaxID=1214573 RepID=A0A0G2FVN0_9PEZI|nr:putative 6-hydroxy-d-nicotine oxidase [Diaporthe ampelina]
MAPIFANESCDPFTDRAAQCVIGSYVQYAVNATGASDYFETLAFAQQRNIRLVIRNTGHDYLGKSTGAGALALWTHHLKDIAVLDYSSNAYTGKSMRVGAGVQASEAQSLANSLGLVVVEGDCPTVGIAGGYTQGGGTSPLGSKFGLAADQVLEGNTFKILQSYLPNGTSQDLERLLQPIFTALDQSEIPYALSAQTSPAFRDAFYAMNPESYMNIFEMNIGGRLVPRSVVSSNSSAARVSDAIKYILHNDGEFVGVSQDLRMSPTSPNSVNPYWRETLFLAFIGMQVSLIPCVIPPPPNTPGLRSLYPLCNYVLIMN